MVQLIEQRVERLEAEQEIRWLQYEYGYRNSRGDWAAVAELFTADGELEFGDQGRYLGPAAIAAYLASTFGGPYGAAAVHAHLQVMPVISLSPGGHVAKGTWRELGFGGGEGVESYWVEGPIEVDYVRTDAGWRMRRLRWYRTLHVSFDEGWQDTHDAPPPAGMPPSAPSSDATPRWPELAETVSFHFKSPIDWPTEPTVPTAVAAEESGLMLRLERLAAVQRIERVQAKAGYYFDKGFWSYVAAMFAELGEIVLPNAARLVGRSAIVQWLDGFGASGPQFGRLLDSVLVQPIVRLDAEGTRATGHWRGFLQWATWGQSHEIGLVDLAVDYVLEDGEWRMARLEIVRAAFTSYDEGWDRDLRGASAMCPVVTSAVRPVVEGPEGDASDARAGLSETVATQESLDLDVLLDELESLRAIERTQFIYGYCLSTFDWDLLTSLFAEDGGIEVAWRGVYEGRASIRRSLELYGGAPGYGVLHNHMQFQPVIGLDAAHESATLRARAFSMMAEYQVSARWMGGLYENEYVRVDGIWQIRKGHLINTYFSPYRVGWKHLPSRDAPGVSDENPPDSPPTDYFRMFPEPYVLPFSYSPPR